MPGISAICFFLAHTLIFKAVQFVPHSNSSCKPFVLLAICFWVQTSVLYLTCKAPGTSCWNNTEKKYWEGEWKGKVEYTSPASCPAGHRLFASSAQGYCVTRLFTVSWPLLEFNDNFSVGGDTMNRWKGSSDLQTYWRGMQANWMLTKPSCPSLWSSLFKMKKEAAFQVTLPAHEFLFGVDIGWPFFHCLSYP